ncbi:MFS transporter [Tsukamurella strandjordii]|uniref:MFS transporter n=1 Tax=Tsukamurella strandjordii TaxID=147577 RepID=A0AA90NDU6_9ACTN|nr:MFS transporter [Tsukamurella strandjordii]MDP0400098.1 MFS transporter [Tsukamurella strandjordii]
MSITEHQRSAARPHPQAWSFALLLTLLALALGVSGLPSPLYPIYQQQWHLSALSTTLVFAVYAIGALGAALTVGPISDAIGRKPVLLVAVATILVGLVIFLFAGAEWQLILARFLHGAAIGSITVVAGAALLDVRPQEGARNGMLSGVFLNVGIAATALGAAAVAQYAPSPLRTPFIAMGVVVLVILIGVIALVEPHFGRTGGRVRFSRPSVPGEITSDFWFSGIGIITAWSVLGVFLSLYPALVQHVTGHRSVIFTGMLVAMMAVASAVAQYVGGRYPARPTAIVGDLGLVVSLGLAVVAVHSGITWLIMVDTVALGATFGLAFGGSLRHLASVAPAHARGQVMSAYYLLGYLAMGVPTVIAGYLATEYGTAAIFPWFAAAVASGCLIAAAIGMRSGRAAAVVTERVV